MEKDPIQNDRRQTQRAQKFGPNAVCICCPERRLVALIPVTRAFLQQHHIACRANDARLVFPLCLNCHAEITEKYRAHGIPTKRPDNILDWIVACLEGVATFLPGLGDACKRWAAELRRFRRALDIKCPGWRDMPEAK